MIDVYLLNNIFPIMNELSLIKVGQSNRIETNLQDSPQRLDYVCFDLSIYGHHPSYIRHLVTYWESQQLSGTLSIVVLPDFLTVHADVVALSSSTSNIHFIPISPSEDSALKDRSSSLNRNIRNFQEWRLFQRYAFQLKAHHCIMLYLDTCLLPIATGMSFPCAFSGIYFRPTFHYKSFQNYSHTPKRTLQEIREKITLSLALRNQRLKTLFCLDPFVIDHMKQIWTDTHFTHVPDPVCFKRNSDIEVAATTLKRQLNISLDKKIFLLFGLLDQRKGIFQILDAISTLSPEVSSRICVVLAGKISCEDASRVEHSRQHTSAQICTQYKFISETDVATYFQMADVVLAPYQRHVGMSGILLQAAAAQKPVLSSNYGLMGELVCQYQLGLAIDSEKPLEIAQGFQKFLLKPPSDFCNFTKMHQLATQNSPERFAETIFEHILNMK